ncbi:MAG: hypothetical protein ACFFE8_05855 [Candidatus Heimdallarchaeota archaeon]
MSYEDYEPDQTEDGRVLKNVTIRGVDSDVYETFSNKIKMLDMTIGDAITKMMRDIVVNLDETFTDPDLKSPLSSRTLIGLEKVAVSHHKKLEINAKDLVDANSQISFAHIGSLKIGPDVTKNLFMRYIRNISHCKEVQLPGILPKLLLLSKISFCGNIEMYEVGSTELRDNDNLD